MKAKVFLCPSAPAGRYPRLNMYPRDACNTALYATAKPQSQSSAMILRAVFRSRAARWRAWSISAREIRSLRIRRDLSSSSYFIEIPRDGDFPPGQHSRHESGLCIAPPGKLFPA